MSPSILPALRLSAVWFGWSARPDTSGWRLSLSEKHWSLAAQGCAAEMMAVDVSVMWEGLVSVGRTLRPLANVMGQ